MIRYYKGTQEHFNAIKDTQEFYKVEDIYINKEGHLYFIIKDKPIKRHKLNIFKKFNIIKIKKEK